MMRMNRRSTMVKDNFSVPQKQSYTQQKKIEQF